MLVLSNAIAHMLAKSTGSNTRFWIRVGYLYPLTDSFSHVDTFILAYKVETIWYPSDYTVFNTAMKLLLSMGVSLHLIHELLSKNSYIVPEEAPLIVLDGKSAMCMANSGKDTKHTRHIARRMHFVRNGEK